MTKKLRSLLPLLAALGLTGCGVSVGVEPTYGYYAPPPPVYYRPAPRVYYPPPPRYYAPPPRRYYEHRGPSWQYQPPRWERYHRRH